MRRTFILLTAGLLVSGKEGPGAAGPRPEAVASGRRVHAEQRVRNILLLHSYDAAYEWTSETTRGIQAALGEQPFEAELWTEFMDARRAPGSEGAELTRARLVRKYSGVRLDLVITADDAATEYALRADSGLPAGVAVVFCGVSGQELMRKLPRERFTGVEEVYQTDRFLKLSMGLWPGTRKVVVITDNSQTGESQREMYRSVAAQMQQLEFEFLNGKDLLLGEILAQLRRLPRESLVVLSAFTRDSRDVYIPQQETGTQIAAASPVPVVSPNTSQMGQGLLAGNANAGYVHGRIAGRLAARVLGGEPTASIPFESDLNLQLVVDGAQARRWGIPPSAYADGAIVVNRPNDWREFYAAHRGLVLAFALGFLVQTLVSVALILSRVRRRRAEAALKASQSSLDRAQEIAKLGTWEADPETGRAEWSKEVFRLYGREPGSFEPTTERFLDLLHPQDRQRVRDVVEEPGEDRQHRLTEYRVVHPDGSTRHMRSLGEWSVRPDGKRVLAGVVQDVTELRELEEHFRHAQRVESLGNLAGGIAHDFNNLLTIINGYSQILLKGMREEDPHQAKVREIHRAGERAAALTRQLLAFSRKQVLEERILDLNEVIQTAAGLLRPLLGESIRYTTRLDPRLRAVKADPYQLEQILLNLAANARDAMPDGGEMRIETRNEDVTLRTSWHGLELEPGPYVRLQVTDTGEGMAEEVRHRVFEPFFTTKPKGKGTGLGLASAFGIVRQSGGRIWVESTPGQGAAFHILLPAAKGRADVSVEPDKVLPAGSGRILVVEDEEQIRALATATLSELGYRVVCAAHPAEALALDPAILGGAPDLLIADIVMPGSSGVELARTMKARAPELRVLLISGYADADMDLDGLKGTAFLAKPFMPVDLATKVRSVLGESAGG